MSKPKAKLTRSENAVVIARREKQILGEATSASYLYVIMEALIEIRDVLKNWDIKYQKGLVYVRKASGK